MTVSASLGADDAMAEQDLEPELPAGALVMDDADGDAIDVAKALGLADVVKLGEHASMQIRLVIWLLSSVWLLRRLRKG